MDDRITIRVSTHYDVAFCTHYSFFMLIVAIELVTVSHDHPFSLIPLGALIRVKLALGIVSFYYPNPTNNQIILLFLGAFVCSGFSRPKWISVAKSARLRKSAAEKRDPKKHLSPSVPICDWKYTNRIPRPKVGVSLAVRQMSRLQQRGLITTWRSKSKSVIFCPLLNFGLPPRCPQVVWCHWEEMEPFSAMLAQDGLAECDQPGKNLLKYSAVAGNWTRVTGRLDSELFHWAIMTHGDNESQTIVRL